METFEPIPYDRMVRDYPYYTGLPNQESCAVVCPPSPAPDSADVYLRVGCLLAERRRLAAGVDAHSFAAARAYAGRVRPNAPYDLLCPGVVRMDAATAAELERSVLAAPTADEDFYATFGTAVLGPLAAGYAHWAWRQWRPLAASGTLVAVMRDGALLGRAVARHAGHAVPEIWLSRPLCLLGAVADAQDRESLRNLLVRARTRPATGAEALDELGLAGEVVPGLDPSAPLAGAGLERLLDWLAAMPAAARHVKATSAAARRAILQHLNAAGALRGTTLGLIDVGYCGTIQRCLTRIAALQGLPLRTLGLYMATSPGAVWATGRDAMVRGFAVQFGAPDWLAAPLIRSRAMLELLLGAPLGPLAGYDHGVPQLAPADYPAEQRAAMTRMQDAALAATARPPGQTAARHLLARLLTAPSAEEIRHFGHWLYQDRLTVAQPQPLDGMLWPAAEVRR